MLALDWSADPQTGNDWAADPAQATADPSGGW
jgi:hypothetical protein